MGALGTYHALGLAKAQGSVFLLASTSEIYGDPEVSPQPEKYWGHVNPIGPRSVYDEAKRFAEAISMAYHREHGVKVRIVRIFNTYGERMRLEDGRALPNFMVQALLGQTLDRVRKGQPDPQLVLCQRSGGGTLPAADVGPDRAHQPGKPGRGFHPATRRGHHPRHAEARVPIVFEPLPEDDPQRRQPDITAAREKLGWEPRVSLENGLAKTLPYFRRELQNPERPAGPPDACLAD